MKMPPPPAALAVSGGLDKGQVEARTPSHTESCACSARLSLTECAVQVQLVPQAV